MAFGKHALINDDGTGLTTEQRLQLSLLEPGNPQAMTQAAVRGVTQNRIRSAMSELAHANISKVNDWLDKVAEGQRDSEGRVIVRPDPAQAIRLFMGLAEYTLPKLKAVAVDVRSSDGSVKQMSIKDLEAIAAEATIVSEQ